MVRVFIFLFLTVWALAQGGPPMLTDDPGTVEEGHWEINTAYRIERRPGETMAEMPLLDLNYGLSERLHFKYEVPWLRLSDDRGHHDGLGNPLAGFKWRFFDQGESAWRVSVFPQVEFNHPGSRSDVRGLGDYGPSVVVPFQAQRNFGAFSLNADAGFVAHRERGDEWFGGCAIGRKLKSDFEVAAELHWNGDERFRASVIVANFGARIGLSERYTLLVSAGRELRNPQELRATFIAYVGLQTRL